MSMVDYLNSGVSAEKIIQRVFFSLKLMNNCKGFLKNQMLLHLEKNRIFGSEFEIKILLEFCVCNSIL